MTRGDSEKNVPVRCEAARVYTVGGVLPEGKNPRAEGCFA